MLAEIDFVGLLGAAGLLLGGLAALLGALGKRKWQRALLDYKKTVDEVAETFDTTEESIDDTTGEVIIDQRKNFKRELDTRTQELRIPPEILKKLKD